VTVYFAATVTAEASVPPSMPATSMTPTKTQIARLAMYQTDGSAFSSMNRLPCFDFCVTHLICKPSWRVDRILPQFNQPFATLIFEYQPCIPNMATGQNSPFEFHYRYDLVKPE
jgi:hypothetical protein